mmetsp:Transcript_24032/g.69140  ORF Transcript_24032/g.69140 Transcript_24032/m.69140 type:complete len:304 (+) Transcript_24032:92-1003(+)
MSTSESIPSHPSSCSLGSTWSSRIRRRATRQFPCCTVGSSIPCSCGTPEPSWMSWCARTPQRCPSAWSSTSCRSDTHPRSARSTSSTPGTPRVSSTIGRRTSAMPKRRMTATTAPWSRSIARSSGRSSGARSASSPCAVTSAPPRAPTAPRGRSASGCTAASSAASPQPAAVSNVGSARWRCSGGPASSHRRPRPRSSRRRCRRYRRNPAFARSRTSPARPRRRRSPRSMLRSSPGRYRRRSARARRQTRIQGSPPPSTPSPGGAGRTRGEPWTEWLLRCSLALSTRLGLRCSGASRRRRRRR